MSIKVACKFFNCRTSKSCETFNPSKFLCFSNKKTLKFINLERDHYIKNRAQKAWIILICIEKKTILSNCYFSLSWKQFLRTQILKSLRTFPILCHFLRPFQEFISTMFNNFKSLRTHSHSNETKSVNTKKISRGYI